ncbi:MAG TPA: DUF2326 domain-containing protein, partial [Xylella taiwanensis]
EGKKNEAKEIRKTLGRSIDNLGKIEDMRLLKQHEVEEKQPLLDAFDFHEQDKALTEKIVDKIDERRAELNEARYFMRMNWKKVKASLREDQILFHPDEAQRLFHEAGVLFQGQIKNDFEQLIAFNRAITAERRGYLEEELAEIEIKLKGMDAEQDDLDKQCFEGLSFLKETGVFIK